MKNYKHYYHVYTITDGHGHRFSALLITVEPQNIMHIIDTHRESVKSMGWELIEVMAQRSEKAAQERADMLNAGYRAFDEYLNPYENLW